MSHMLDRNNVPKPQLLNVGASMTNLRHKSTPLLFGFALFFVSCGDTPEDHRNQEEGPVRSELAIVMDPKLNEASEVLWDSAGYIDTYEGTTDLTPTTPEGWQAVVDASDLIIEISKVLKDPKYSQERPGWNQLADALALAAGQNKDAALEENGEKLFQAGADLYQVCVACHQVFWSNNRFSI